VSLTPGTRLGPYEIVAPIGAGGMGEVYRARDAKLGREVAIKVLPSATASDPDRRQRFELEARAASALNHPNILTIYDIGEADGTVYIAMELIEGKTLRELVAAGEPLATKRLLDLAAQIAEGLAKAHSAGIVHRDLKPENVMVSKDGYAKILDFGLAKLTETSSAEGSVLPTAVAAPTQPGTVMGTAGYMSPEQASGQPVDYRSDQFSLGTIVYEMATGRRAFQRKTGAETLVAIIREEPEPIAHLAPAAPAPVRWIVDRLLSKDPDERYASTRDLAREIESVRDHLSETTASGGLTAAEPVKPRRRPRLAAAAAGALLLGALAGGLLVRGISSGGGGAPTSIRQLTFSRGTLHRGRFAPDGQTIVYSAAWSGRPLEIFTTRADSAEARSLGLTGADLLSVSSAGELAVALNRRNLFGFEMTGTLARVPLAGGAPREVLEGVEDADWSPDGKELAVARWAGRTSRIEYPIGKVIYEAPGWASDVRVSPDGRLVAFIDHRQRGDNDGELKVVDRDGKVRMTGPFATFGVAWSRSGDEVWSGGRGISATSLSGKSRMAYNAPGAFIDDLAEGDRLLFHVASIRREAIAVSAADSAERDLSWFNWSFPNDISPDGSTLFFDEQNIENRGLYLRKLDGAPAVRIGEGTGYQLSPDGKWALASRDPGAGILQLLPSGAGESKDLPATGLNIQSAAWFPDGKRLLLSGNEPGRSSRLYVFDLSGGKPRPITPEGVGFLFFPVSPDGRFVAATDPERRTAIYPIEPGEPRVVPGLQPEDTVLRWTPDGKALLTFRPSAPPLRVEEVDIATGARTLRREIQPRDPSGINQVGPYLEAPDGKTYVYSFRRSIGELYLASWRRQPSLR
jgi:dipeptidyl aminopeptidase/acylaminoacyl peptidase/predicted Ser/Thr protein kinase